MKHKQLEIFASECQMEADRMAYTLITDRSNRVYYDAAQSYCDFNTWHSFGILGWYKDVFKFIAKNGEQLKRKFTLSEFISFATQYRMKTMNKELKDFEHFKQIKIKKYDRNIKKSTYSA